MTATAAAAPRVPTAQTAVPTAPATVDTVADLLARLGDVPPSRVRMVPTPGTATEDDIEVVRERDNVLCELVHGTLVEKTVGLYESMLALAIAGAIRDFIKGRHLGRIGGEQGTFRVVPENIRIPDVSFTARHRLPADIRGGLLRRPAPRISPDLAIEVLSPRNTAAEIRLKRQEYFAGGTRLMWVFDPFPRTATVYTSADGDGVVFGNRDKLDGGDVLPGFVLDIGAVFAEVDDG